MITVDPLYELINSLSISEKGYFKKSVPKNSIYVKLFDILNTQKTYNEKEISKLFKSNSESKNIAVVKNYLYESILASLQNYHKEKTIEWQLNAATEQLKILYDKGLYNQCKLLLEKSKKLAYEYELYIYLLPLIAFEFAYNQFKLIDSTQLFEEEKQVLNLLNEISTRNAWYSKVLAWVQQNDKAKNEVELNELSSLYQKPKGVFTSKEPFKAINSAYGTDTLYYYAIGNPDKATEAKLNQLTTYLGNDLMRNLNYKNFLLVYANVLSLLYNSKQTELFQKYYSKLPEYFQKNSSFPYLEKEIIFAHGLSVFKLNNDWLGGKVFSDSIEQELDKTEGKLSLIRLSDIQFNAAVCCFWANDFRSSVKWLNKILNNPKIENRLYLHCYSKILQLILHTELNNVDLLKSLSTSTYKYLYKKNKIYEFEEIILKHLKFFLKTKSEIERKKSYQNLYYDLQIISQDKIKSQAMDHFDYLKWLEKKLN